MEEQVFLQGTIRERLQDLMKSSKITQAELATRLGCSESLLSRFLTGKTDKLGDENIIRIARVFNVSTDFLLGETDHPLARSRQCTGQRRHPRLRTGHRQ